MDCLRCLICRRSGQKTFNINFMCGDAQYTIKDDITEFLGSKIQPHLKPEDVVCNICMNLLEDIATIKRKLWNTILTPRDSKYPIKLGKSWDFFARIYKTARNQFDESDFDEPITPSSLTPLSVVPNSNRSTPSQFWSISHCKDYNQELEERCARRETAKRKRSQSKSSIRSESSYGNDEEVAKLFKGKRRRGRRPKSAGGLPKIMTNRLRRVQSENGRCTSSLSDQSCVSYTRPRKDFRPRTPKLIYGEDNELIRPRTRSISRMLFYCSDCLEDKKDLNLFTAHMVLEHNRKACYTCLDCGVSLTTQDHLTLHQKMHNYSTMCTICGKIEESIIKLQKHTDRHFQYSVPCSYCDLSFLSQYECNLHMFNHHRGKRRKLRERKPYKIEQVVNYVNADTNTQSWDKNYSTKKFDAVPMILNIEERPKFHGQSFEELDFRLRHPEPITKPKEITSLGDDLVVNKDERFLHSRSSYSPSSVFMFSDSDSDVPLSDSSVFESVSQRKRRKPSRPTRKKRSTNRDKDLSQLNKSSSPNEDLQGRMSDVDDRLSPSQDGVPVYRNENIRFGEDSNSSEHSDSIQTEMHYVDGNTIHTNVDLADIVNITSGLNESNPHEEGVELDPDIGDE